LPSFVIINLAQSQLNRRFEMNILNWFRTFLSPHPGQTCPRCGQGTLEQTITERCIVEESYGGGYAHASSFKSGCPPTLVCHEVTEVFCPQCPFRKRIREGLEYVKEEEEKEDEEE
jgi:hypothetical protein